MLTTIFLNTRSRPKILHECLSAIHEQTYDISKVIIKVRYDEDDILTKNYIKKNSFASVEWIEGPRPSNLIQSLNKLSADTNSHFLFGLNDDAIIKTKDWDIILQEKFINTKKSLGIRDNIFYFRTECDSVDRDKSVGYSSFPIITNEAVKVLGFYQPEDFVGLGGDSSVFLIYKGVNRVVDCGDIKIHHCLHDSIDKINAPDATAYEMRLNTQKNYKDPYKFDFMPHSLKLKSFIESYE